jgi:hypothetical protein
MTLNLIVWRADRKSTLQLADEEVFNVLLKYIKRAD